MDASPNKQGFREHVVNWHHRLKHNLQDFPKNIPYHLGFHSVEACGDPDFKDFDDLDLRTFLGACLALAFALLAALGFGDPSVEPFPLEEGVLPVPGAVTAGFIPLG